jgi:hypothetical protein
MIGKAAIRLMVSARQLREAVAAWEEVARRAKPSRTILDRLTSDKDLVSSRG